MKKRIRDILNFISEKKQHKYRRDIQFDLGREFRDKKFSYMKRATERLIRILDSEIPVILPDDRIVYLRTIRKIPGIYTTEEWDEINKEHFVFGGQVSNISSDYETTIRVGLEERRNETNESLKKYEKDNNEEAIEFLNSVIQIIDAIERMADRYCAEAQKTGRQDVADIFSRVPRYGARTFHEALQFFRILHFTLWSAKHIQNTVGRFDQYMYPYLKADLDSGRLDNDSAFELLEEFFISFNRDSDLYPGVQQGDNGQSMVLGGVDEYGNDSYNILSEMCLKASLELNLIDPKINLRVNKNTKLEIYELGTELTKQGLGFPQYENDEIVIPGLVAMGYDIKDARNYVVAACWEFIIPKCGMDIPNIDALSFVKVVNICVHKDLANASNFSSFMIAVNSELKSEINAICESVKNIFVEPAPFQSLLMEGCIENAKDISKGNKYNNYGIHGTGIATAADSLAALKKYVFEEKSVSPQNIVNALDADFGGYEDLQSKLKYDAPKMGNDDDFVDSIAVELFNMFADAVEGKTNERDGCFRAGSGTAMYYIWHANEIGASPDGRKKGEPLAANFSPSLNARMKGPVSIIKSFSKPNMKRIINGGPLTMEIHDTVFRNDQGKKKVAMLVKSYMDMGGQQMQLNATNRERLLDAQKHPEKYRNLIVRVWGWSGYFVELDKEYQDHIIKRVELQV